MRFTSMSPELLFHSGLCSQKKKKKIRRGKVEVLACSKHLSLSLQSKEPKMSDFLTLLTQYHQQAQKTAQSWDQSAGLGPGYVDYCLQRPTSRLKETGTSLPANILWIGTYMFLVLQMGFLNKVPGQHKACKDEKPHSVERRTEGKE